MKFDHFQFKISGRRVMWIWTVLIAAKQKFLVQKYCPMQLPDKTSVVLLNDSFVILLQLYIHIGIPTCIWFVQFIFLRGDCKEKRVNFGTYKKVGDPIPQHSQLWYNYHFLSGKPLIWKNNWSVPNCLFLIITAKIMYTKSALQPISLTSPR